MPKISGRLRSVPSIDRVLNTPTADVVLARFDRELVKHTVRAVLDELRRSLAAGHNHIAPSADEVMALALTRIEQELPLRMRRIVNATGVVLHTNLGRAVLAPEAITAVETAASGAVNLELDADSGKRGSRDDLVTDDLRTLTGADAATVVNNNAAAVLLALNTLAEGRQVIVSRGELIEIGGSFRIPDVLAKSGAKLREVGTTNRTHARDYEAAVGDDTALLLKVHTSNYRIVGFTSDVSLTELVAIGRAHGLPVMEDLGSGALIDLSAHGLPKEPLVSERLALGVDLVSFSGDKLLGGPQAGILVGRRDLIDRINRNPLKRALRCDKLTLAALAATLRLYRTSPDLRQSLPTLRCLTRPLEEMTAIGEAAVPLLRQTLGVEFEIELIDSEGEIGSGALPVESLPSKAIAITSQTMGEDAIATMFRRSEPPVIGRIHAGRFLLDLRTIFDPSDLVPQRPAPATPNPEP
jgi:L-seryl-tRNA(Ser) seleniumtransferase